MKYVMVLLVPFYQVNDDEIACESAFAAHLKELLPRIQQWGSEIVIHSPSMTEEKYQADKSHLTHIRCADEKISYVPSVPTNISRGGFLLKAPFSIWPTIWRVVKSANVVHSGASKNVFQLFSIMAIIFAVIQKKKTLFVMDIDHRNSSTMLYKTGKYSRKTYLLSRYIYNPIISLQIRFAAKFCDLVMLKGRALAEDYGKNKPHVKNFYNTVHDLSFIIDEDTLAKKIAHCSEQREEIKLVYFGRITEYKGILDMIDATKQVADRLAASSDDLPCQRVSLCIIGSGDQKAALEQYVADKQLEQWVSFKNALNYGNDLFDELTQYDFLLAAPKSEDTPRSVFDAMASGLPIIAYDTYYYTDLESTGAVKTVEWLSVNAMSDKILELANDHQTTQQLINNARDFAVDNTQEIWMNRRLAWTKEFLSDG